MFRSSIIRVFLALAAAAAIVTYFGVPYISDALTAGYRVHSEHRARALLLSSEGALRDFAARHDRIGQRAYLATVLAGNAWVQGLVICRSDGTVNSQTERAPSGTVCRSEQAARDESNRLIQTTDGRLQITDYELADTGQPPLRAVVVQDLGFADWSRSGWRGFVVAFVGLSALGLALLVSVVIWWLLRRWAQCTNG